MLSEDELVLLRRVGLVSASRLLLDPELESRKLRASMLGSSRSGLEHARWLQVTSRGIEAGAGPRGPYLVTLRWSTIAHFAESIPPALRAELHASLRAWTREHVAGADLPAFSPKHTAEQRAAVEQQRQAHDERLRPLEEALSLALAAVLDPASQPAQLGLFDPPSLNAEPERGISR